MLIVSHLDFIAKISFAKLPALHLKEFYERARLLHAGRVQLGRKAASAGLPDGLQPRLVRVCQPSFGFALIHRAHLSPPQSGLVCFSRTYFFYASLSVVAVDSALRAI